MTSEYTTLISCYVKAPFKWLRQDELADKKGQPLPPKKERTALLFNSKILAITVTGEEDSRNAPGRRMQLNKNGELFKFSRVEVTIVIHIRARSWKL